MDLSAELLALLNQGMLHLRSGEIALAESLFRRALGIDESSVHANYALGLACYASKRMRSAEQSLRRAIEVSPAFFPAHATLALVLRAQNQLDDAIVEFERALVLKPDYQEAAYNAALSYADRNSPGDRARAISLNKEVLAQNDSFIAAHTNLGNLLRLNGEFDVAYPHLARAARELPQDASAQINLTLVLTEIGRYNEAIQAGTRATQLAPNDYETWEALGNAQLLAGDSGGAVVSLGHATQLHPDDPPLQYDFGAAQMANGDLAAGRKTLDAVAKARPDWLKVLFERDLALPPLYLNDDHIAESRAGWIKGLEGIEARIFARDDWSVGEATTAMASHAAFYLNYQDADNTALQKRFARVVQHVVRRAYPAYTQPLAWRAGAHGGKLRIGFTSAYLRKHSVGYFFGAWITELDTAKFESFVWHFGEISDDVTEKIRARANHFYRAPNDHGKFAQAILEAKLDVLIHLDIGMHPHSQVLAALRLAPIQCAAYGHPVTTALDSIDHYLTADLAEPAGAQLHYTEPLIRLPKLAVSYPMPDISKRALPPGFARERNRPLLLCTQRLFKVLPHFDRLAARIARELGEVTLAFYASMSPSLNDAFVKRLSAALRAEGVSPESTIKMLPSMTFDHFLGVVEAADLVLDTTYFSGGNSSFDTFAVCTPIVTYEAPMMRGRQTSAMLRIMGIPELIARTDDDYVKIAVELARSPKRRVEMRQRIKQGHTALFDDLSAVRALENALEKLIRG
jgi:protein O-GlcNAc transferase